MVIASIDRSIVTLSDGWQTVRGVEELDAVLPDGLLIVQAIAAHRWGSSGRGGLLFSGD